MNGFELSFRSKTQLPEVPACLAPIGKSDPLESTFGHPPGYRPVVELSESRPPLPELQSHEPHSAEGSPVGAHKW